MEDFPTYRQDVIVGHLQVTAPLGQYDSDKLVNIGTNRWSFKPELGLSKALGPLTLELLPSVTFFTDNNDFFGGKTSAGIHYPQDISSQFSSRSGRLTHLLRGRANTEGEGRAAGERASGLTTALSRAATSRSSSTAAPASTTAPTTASGRSGSPGNTAGGEGCSEQFDHSTRGNRIPSIEQEERGRC
jgi:hypothetical protein